jgi:hypothetical protein
MNDYDDYVPLLRCLRQDLIRTIDALLASPPRPLPASLVTFVEEQMQRALASYVPKPPVPRLIDGVRLAKELVDALVQVPSDLAVRRFPNEIWARIFQFALDEGSRWQRRQRKNTLRLVSKGFCKITNSVDETQPIATVGEILLMKSKYRNTRLTARLSGVPECVPVLVVSLSGAFGRKRRAHVVMLEGGSPSPPGSPNGLRLRQPCVVARRRFLPIQFELFRSEHLVGESYDHIRFERSPVPLTLHETVWAELSQKGFRPPPTARLPSSVHGLARYLKHTQEDQDHGRPINEEGVP